jgi:hypothetical protein
MNRQQPVHNILLVKAGLYAAIFLANLAVPGATLAQTYTDVFHDGFNGNLNNWAQLRTSVFTYQTAYAGSGEGAVVNHNTYTGAGWAFCNQVASQMSHSLGTRPFAQGRVTGYFSDGRSGWKAGVCGGSYGQMISLRDKATVSGSSVYVDNGYSGGTDNTKYYYRNSSTTYTSFGTRCATADCNRRWFKFQTTVMPNAPGSSPAATFTVAVTQAGTCTTTLSTAVDAASTFFNYGIAAVHLGNGQDSTQDAFWDDILFEAYTPGAPTIGTATANSTSQITWTWTKAADHNLFGFDITDSNGTLKSPDYPATGWIDRADTSWAETGLSANTSYTRKAKAWNGSLNSAFSSTATKYTLQNDATAPTFSSVTETSFRVTTMGPANLASGSSGVIFHDGTADRAKVTQLYDDVTGLTANSEYTFKAKGVNGDGVVAGYSTTANQWTLSVPPSSGSVTPDTASPCAENAVTWTAVGGFGTGKIQKYKYVWDQSPTHTWTESEADWSSGTVQTMPTAAGTWFLHIKGYNGATPAVANGTYDYAVTANALPAAPNAGYTRSQGTSLKVKISDLTPDTIQSLGSATHGTVSKNATYIFYAPFANDNNNDSFTYTAANAHSCMKQATINITVAVAGGEAQEATWVDGKPTIKFAGIPGYSYVVERAENANFTLNLTTVLTTNVPSSGLFTFVDNDPPESQAFYRLKHNP